MNPEQEMFNKTVESDSMSPDATVEDNIAVLKCEHFVLYLECEECLPKLSRRQAINLLEFFKKKHREFGAARQKRVKALNKKFLKQKQQAAANLDETDKQPRSITIRFNLDHLPLPIKDRELLYKDYHRSRVGIKDQWNDRLLELDYDKAAFRKELVAMTAKLEETQLN